MSPAKTYLPLPCGAVSDCNVPCFSPINGYRAKTKNPSGKYSVVFDKSSGFTDQPITLPCGRCRGCRLRKSEEWAIRSHCEAQTHEKNVSVTLTYDEKHLPPGGSITVRTMQLFLKKLRKHFHKEKIRFLLCGEYGDLKGRPHYHAILYNCSFEDQIYEEESKTGHSLYSSKTLSAIWGKGRALIGEVNFETSAYVARYIMKKITGDEASETYKGKTPEFNTMSRMPGLGATWLKKYHADVYPHDFIVIDGKKRMPPKYFDTLYEQIDPDAYHQIKLKRSIKTPEQILEQDSFRLLAKEAVAEAQFKQLKRNLHNET